MHQAPSLSALLAATALFLAAPPFRAADKDPFDQSGVPIEVEPTDAKLAKIVLVAGTPSHKPGEHEFFAGCALLMKLLSQTPGVAPVMARDGWPRNPKTLQNARTIVFFMNGGGEQTTIKGDHAAELQKLMDGGTGIVHLHAVIDYPTDLGDRARGWLGGCYEPKFSKRAHWVTTFKDFPEHPITRGVKPFTIDDGYLYNLRFVPGLKGVTPLLRTVSPTAKLPPDKKPGDDAIVSWAYERPDGGRAFVFTGGHLHKSLGEEGYRRYLVNGILWTAKVDVPKEGAKVALDAADLNKHLDRKDAKKP
jgi:hypothetical protein